MFGASLTQWGMPAGMWTMSPALRMTSFPPSMAEPRVSPGRPAVVIGVLVLHGAAGDESYGAFRDDNLIGEELMALGVAGVNADDQEGVVVAVVFEPSYGERRWGLPWRFRFNLASRCCRSEAVWTMGSVDWASSGAAASARERKMRRGMLAPLGWPIVMGGFWLVGERLIGRLTSHHSLLQRMCRPNCFGWGQGRRFALSRECPHLKIEIWGTRFCGFCQMWDAQGRQPQVRNAGVSPLRSR